MKLSERRRDFSIMFEDEVICDIKFRPFGVKQYSDNNLIRPFLKEDGLVTLEDVEEWIEYRCFPRNRANKKELLEYLGLDLVGYVPLEILRKTHGVMSGDYLWAKFEGEDLAYKDLPGHKE